MTELERKSASRLSVAFPFPISETMYPWGNIDQGYKEDILVVLVRVGRFLQDREGRVTCRLKLP
jgi:hypothetical protein